MRTFASAFLASMPVAALVLPMVQPTLLLAAEPPSITMVAPKDSIAIVTIPNWAMMRTAFDKTSMANLWREPSVQRYIDDLTEQMKSESADATRMLTRWRDFAREMDEPTGAVGLAVHMAQTKSKEADFPPQNLPHVILLSDFGDGAEKAESEIVKLLREGVADGLIKLDERSEDGIVRYTIEFVEKANDEGADDDEMNGDDDFDFDDEGGPDLDHLDTMHLARVGGSLILASHDETFGRCLRDLRAGRGDGLADQPLFKDAMAQVGTDNHMSATIMLTDGLRQQIRTALADGPMLPIPIPVDFPKLIEALGLTEFKAASVGMKFNTAAADVEQTIGLLSNGKRGLFSLLDAESSAFNPPAFAPADAISVGRFTVKFDQLMGVIRNVATIFPAEMKAEIDGGLQAFEGSFGPALRALGPNVYTTTSITRPFSATSEQQLVAIECKDELAVNNAVLAFAGQIGAEARDFQGFQVYDGGFVPTAIGIGAGHVFIGTSEAVENGLRAASKPAEGSKLADEPRFRKAVAALKGQGNSYSYMAGRESVEFSYWRIQNAGKIALAQLREAGIEISPEDEDEYTNEAMEKWTKNLPPVEDIAKHIGDAVSVFRPSPDGFQFTSLVLRPKDAR